MLAADGMQLLQHLGWKEVHIVGMSLGGMIAMELALLLLDFHDSDNDDLSLHTHTQHSSLCSKLHCSTTRPPNLLSLTLVSTHSGNGVSFSS